MKLSLKLVCIIYTFLFYVIVKLGHASLRKQSRVPVGSVKEIIKIRNPFSECEQGTHGPNCSKTCDCADDTPCDPVSGACACAPGKTGLRCDAGELPGFLLQSRAVQLY